MRERFAQGDAGGQEIGALRALLELRMGARDTLERELADRKLFREIEAWIEAHHHETRRAAAALDLLEILGSGATVLEKVLAFFAMEGRLTRIPAQQVSSYGPRRALYPQVVSLDEQGDGFGADTALFRDRCLVDEIVGFAEEQALALRA